QEHTLARAYNSKEHVARKHSTGQRRQDLPCTNGLRQTAELLRSAYIFPLQRLHPWQVLCLIHPRQRCRQDKRYASSFPFSRRAKTLRPDLVAVVAGGGEEFLNSFYEWCGTADITSRAKICGPSCGSDQGGIDAARWSRP